MFKFIRSEKGQVMVEFAIVIPIFLLLLFFLIDLGWIIYQKVTFDYTCRKMAWDLNLSSDEDWVMNTRQPIYYSGYNANRLLKTEFDKNIKGTHIDKNKVSITDGMIAIYPGRKLYKHRGGATTSGDVDFKTTTLEIQGKIKYKIEPLTPIAKPFFGNSITLNSNLYKARRGRMQTD